MFYTFFRMSWWSMMRFIQHGRLDSFSPSVVVLVLAHIDRVSSTDTEKLLLRLVQTLTWRFTKWKMLATSTSSSTFPFPSIRFFLNFFDGLWFTVTGLFTCLLVSFVTNQGRWFQAVTFTSPAAGSYNATLFRQFFFDYRLRFSIDESGRIASIGWRTRRGRRWRQRSWISFFQVLMNHRRRCLFGNVFQSTKMWLATFHHRLMNIRSSNAPRPSMKWLRMWKDFDTTRTSFCAVDQLWWRLVLTAGQWP